MPPERRDRSGPAGVHTPAGPGRPDQTAAPQAEACTAVHEGEGVRAGACGGVGAEGREHGGPPSFLGRPVDGAAGDTRVERAGRERGMVTAEVAVALPGVVMLLVVVLGAAAVAVGQVRCVDAARAAARAAARNEPAVAVRSAALGTAPDAAVVTVGRSGTQVVVAVRAQVGLALPGSPSVSVGARAVAEVEPSTAAQLP